MTALLRVYTRGVSADSCKQKSCLRCSRRNAWLWRWPQACLGARTDIKPAFAYRIHSDCRRHEGDGSVFALLKARGLAMELAAGESGMSFSGASLFSVHIVLTDEGACVNTGDDCDCSASALARRHVLQPRLAVLRLHRAHRRGCGLRILDAAFPSVCMEPCPSAAPSSSPSPSCPVTKVRLLQIFGKVQLAVTHGWESPWQGTCSGCLPCLQPESTRHLICRRAATPCLRTQLPAGSRPTER